MHQQYKYKMYTYVYWIVVGGGLHAIKYALLSLKMIILLHTSLWYLYLHFSVIKIDLYIWQKLKIQQKNDSIKPVTMEKSVIGHMDLGKAYV